MGVGTWSRQYNEIVDPEFNPNIDEPASYPTNYGFSGERVERKMIATEDEMVKAKVPLKHRDYCAHYYINFLKCNRDRGALDFWACDHEKHDWEEKDDRRTQTSGSLAKQVSPAPLTLIEIKG